jgi:hypothetical protein
MEAILSSEIFVTIYITTPLITRNVTLHMFIIRSKMVAQLDIKEYLLIFSVIICIYLIIYYKS